jgi:SAM-dependent methyltransferase
MTRSTNDDWETLGRADPLWAVYVAPGAERGRWHVDAFLATGRAEVDRVLAQLGVLAPSVPRSRALDFGCGVGRLSAALAAHFDEVVGVDVSPAMLDWAREVAGDRCTFLLNKSDDLSIIESDSVDVSYSSLVLQHLPRDRALGYLSELIRVTRPNGCVIVQVASRPDWSLKGMIFRFAPPALIGWAQRRLLGYPAPMLMTALPESTVRRTVAQAKATVLAAEPDSSYGGHWKCVRYFIRPA